MTDAAVLSTHAGGALIVVGAGIVNKDHLRRALEAVEAVNGNTLGLVLNRLPRQDSGGYGTYAYDYTSDTPRTHAKRQPHPTPENEARVSSPR